MNLLCLLWFCFAYNICFIQVPNTIKKLKSDNRKASSKQRKKKKKGILPWARSENGNTAPIVITPYSLSSPTSLNILTTAWTACLLDWFCNRYLGCPSFSIIRCPKGFVFARNEADFIFGYVLSVLTVRCTHSLCKPILLTPDGLCLGAFQPRAIHGPTNLLAQGNGSWLCGSGLTVFQTWYKIKSSRGHQQPPF